VRYQYRTKFSKAMKMLQNVTILTICLFLFIKCDTSITGPDGPGGELPRDLTATEKMLIEADGSFSYDIFRRTVAWETDHDNLMISPLSISMALAMTLNGAEGQTYEDMREALYLAGMNLDEINDSFRSLIELLVTVDPKVTMKIANSVWHSDQFDVNPDFKERVKTYFDAEVSELDFRDPAAADPINAWVREKTDGLIEELLDEIDEDRIMYLINALYFKGDWLRQFDRDDTQSTEFYLESGESVMVDMMKQKGLFATYFDGDVQMIELPYGDSLFTMSVLMPANSDTPVDRFIEEQVSASNLAEWRSNLRVDMRESTIHLPKFELEYEIKLNDVLNAMGMEIAFDEWEANFSGLSAHGQRNLFLDEVLHKTFIRVDEEGTEAAAVTSVGVMPTSMPPQMIVNRPFVFIIHERESGANLFMGKVKNPGLE
jgi:serine protease inhibitor